MEKNEFQQKKGSPPNYDCSTCSVNYSAILEPFLEHKKLATTMAQRYILRAFSILVMLLAVYGQTPGAKIRIAMQKAQVIGTTSSSIGAGLNSGIVASLRNYHRSAPYDMNKKKFTPTPTTNRIENFDFINGNSKSLDDAINYGEGVAMYALLGIIFLLLTVIWIFIYIGICCYGCCIHCCCPIKRKPEDNTNYKNRLNIGRGVIGGYVVLTLILLLPWTILTWQANEDISNTIDKTVSQTVVLQNYINNGFLVTNNISNFADSVQASIRNVQPTILAQLPIANTTACFNTIIDGLPNTTIMLAFIQQAQASINALPDLNAIQQNMLAVPSNISYVQQTSFVPVYSTFLGIQQNIENINLQLLNLAVNLGILNVSLTNLNISNTINLAQNMMNPIQNTLTDSMLSSLYKNLTTDINTMDPQITSNSIYSVATAVDNLNGVDLSTLQVNLGYISAIVNVSAASMTQSVHYIQGNVSQVNFTLGELQLANFNSSLGSIFGDLENMLFQLRNMSNAINSFPLPTELDREIAKINSTINNLACVANVIHDIQVINQTLVQLSPSISNSISQFSNIRSKVTSLNESAIPTDALNNIGNEMLSVQPQVNTMAENFTTVLSTLSTAPLQGLISSTASNFSNLFLNYNLTAIGNDISLFQTQQANIVDQTQTSAAVGAIKLASGNFNTANARSNAATLASQSNPCTTCQASTYQTLSTSVANLQNAIDTLPGGGISLVSQLQTTKTALKTMPDMKADYNATSQAVKSANIVLIGITVDMIGLILLNTSLGVLEALPYSQVIPIIKPVENEIKSATPLFSSATQEINNFNSTIVQVEENNPATMLSSIVGSFSSLNNMSNPLTSAMDQINSPISTLNNTINTIWGYRDTYMVYVYQYDGIRLLVLAILILIPIFLPLLATLVVCCPRWPCTLLFYSFAVLIASIISWILVAFLLPINVFTGDTCSNMDYYVNNAALLFGSFNQSFSIQKSVMNTNISVDIEPLRLLSVYLNSQGCQGQDPLANTLNGVNQQLSNISTGIAELVNQQLEPEGFLLLSGGYTLIGSLAAPILSNASQLLTGISNYIGCPSVNALYTSTKSVVCTNTNNVIAALDLSFVLLGLLFSFAAVFSSFTYCYMVRNQEVNQDVAVLEEGENMELGNVIVDRDETKIQYDPSYRGY